MLGVAVAACGGQVAASNSGDAGASGGSGAGGGTTSTGGSGGSPIGPPPAGACNLSLVASGQLPQQGQRTVESVAVARSAKSFTVAYVERSASTRDATLVNLADGGQLGNVVRNDLPSCANAATSHGAAITFDYSGTAGLAAFAAGDCTGSGAGALFVGLGPGGTPSQPKQTNTPDFSSMRLGPHALASIGPNRFAFVYNPGSASSTGAQLATLTGDQFDGGAVSLFGAEAADSAAISTTDTVRGILGHLTSGSETLTIGFPGSDAGADFRLSLGGQAWGAVAAIGTRVGVVFPSPGGLDYKLFPYDPKPIALSSGGFEGPAFALGDLAALGNRLIAVGASGTELDAYRVDNATGATPTHDMQALNKFSGNVGTTPLPAVQNLAIAAARGKVAIVYAGKGTPGYWALLSCAN